MTSVMPVSLVRQGDSSSLSTDLAGADPLHRRDGAMQYVVQAVIFVDPLHGGDIARILDHTIG